MEETVYNHRQIRLRCSSALGVASLSVFLIWGCATGKDTEPDSWTPGAAGGTNTAGASGFGAGADGGEQGGSAGESGTGGAGAGGGAAGVAGQAGGTGGGGTGGGGTGGGGAGGAGGSAPTGGAAGSSGSGGASGGTGGGPGGTGGTTGGSGGGTPAPSCDDQIQNQGEEGIDCGGPCPTPCPSCSDQIQNQGETGIDCGGPCPPCGFTHEESFDYFPNWSPDGPYSTSGSCAQSSKVDGWYVTNYVSPTFTLGDGYYAVIDTASFSYFGVDCDDLLVSPPFDSHGATQLTIEFDTHFATYLSSIASVLLDADGALQVLWTKSVNVENQRITLGPISVAGKKSLRVLWRYQGTYEYHWMVDNIKIQGK